MIRSETGRLLVRWLVAAVLFAASMPARGQCTGCANASFSAPGSATSGIAHNGVAVADFDQDGRLDVAVPNSSGGEGITIHYGDGAGGFRSDTQSLHPMYSFYPTRAITADLNGDGLPDLLGADGNLHVWVSDGLGGFEHRGPVEGLPIFSYSFEVGDFNGDGIPDLVWPDPANSAVLLRLGNGDGTFQSAISFPVAGGPSRLVVGDFNGDSKPDIAVSRQGADETVSILLGDGAGGLILAGTAPFTGNALAIAAGDFNHDGNLDVAVGGAANSFGNPGFVSIFFGDGNGQLAAGPTLTDVSPYSLVAADLSGDSIPDLVAVDQGNHGLTVYLNAGDGTFDAPSFYRYFGAAAVGDFDRDGRLDVVLAQYDVFVVRNDGSGHLLGSPYFPLPGYALELRFADLNGDSSVDLLAATGPIGSSTITSFLGNGDGTFGATHSADTGYQPAGLSVADFNGDGKADVAFVDGFHVVLLPGDGTGGFGATTPFDAGTFPTAAASADFNGDGKPDVVAVGWNVVVLLNDGAGGFAAGVTLQGNGGDFVAVGDLDGQNGPDIVVSQSIGFAVYLNDGAGGFTGPFPVSDTGGGRFALADFDGDGTLDIVANSLDGIAFFRGDGAGGFLAPVVALPGIGSYDIQAADFNGDGHPDLLLASQGVSLEIALGDGAGGFGTPQGFALPVGSMAAFGTGDVDGDGKPDLIGADSEATVLRNTNCIPRRLNLSTDASTCAPVGAPIGGPPTVGVYDDGGNLVTCDSTLVTASLLPGTGTPGATLGGTTAVAAVAGVAAFTDLSIDLAGNGYRIGFTHPIASPTGSRPVTVGDPPSPPVASNSGPFCQGQDLDLYAATVPGAVYRWTGPNGFSSTVQSPVIQGATPEAAGDYSVVALVGGCVSTAAQTTVAMLPPQVGPSILGPHQICGTTPLLLRADTTAFAYQWFLNGAPIPGANGASYLVDQVSGADSGNYTITISDATGCTTDPGPAFGVTIVGCSFLPEALAIDPPGGSGNGNGILEPGELAVISPSWMKTPSGSATPLTGAAVAFTGPAGGSYAIGDASADYGTIAPGQTSDCASATGDCYRITASASGGRPATHWDTFLDEAPSTGSPTRTWMIHVGGSFTDVPAAHPFYAPIETVLHNRITAGCSLAAYCPSDWITRAQMAVLLLKARHSADYAPPPATGTVFADVPANAFAAAWIEELSAEQITAGCGGGLYCPANPVTRAQMAVFLLRALYGPGLGVPPCTGIFQDVACPGGFAVDWIEFLYSQGITAGCSSSPLLYCPDANNTRGQMAAFLTRTFGLLLYGP